LVELPLLLQNKETLGRSVEIFAERVDLQKVELNEITMTVKIATEAMTQSPSFILAFFVMNVSISFYF